MMLLSPDDPENPLSTVIRPGDTVVIKPNFCTLSHYPTQITHPSVLVSIVDYAVKAGASRIVIAEGPINPTQGLFIFRSRYTNVKGLVRFFQVKYPKVEIRFQDTNFDRFIWVEVGEHSELRDYVPHQLYHPNFHTVAQDIFYHAVDGQGFSPQGYRVGVYAIAEAFLKADVFISVPKLKTHHQTGITIALKNVMGLNRANMGDVLDEEIKERLRNDPTWAESPSSRDVPHFGVKEGTLEDRLTDEASGRLLNFENDVLWRSLADLNKIIRYADAKGHLRPTPQRRVLVLVDGIVGGEGEGPTGASPKVTHAILAGLDPVNVDAMGLRVMGWDVETIRLVKGCAGIADPPIGSIVPLEEALVGVEPSCPVFGQFYEPPGTYADETIAPYSVRRSTSG